VIVCTRFVSARLLANVRLYCQQSGTQSKYHGKVQSVTDLCIGQIGHGLGPRAFGGPAQLFPI